MTESQNEWQHRWDLLQRVKDVWRTPIILSWLGILVVWYFLVYRYCPDTFNPHGFNPKIHQVITPDGVLINDAGDITDEDGYVYASKWRDPRTNKILTPEHKDVVSGERNEKFARAIVTFFCGLPLLYVYVLRKKAWGDSYSEIKDFKRNGLFVCLAAGVISYFVPVVELAWSIAGASAYHY